MAKPLSKAAEMEARLPKAGTVYDYTPEQIKEFTKCANDIFYFADNYYYLINPEKGKSKISIYPIQRKAIKKMLDNRFVLLLASRQVGKSTMMALVALWHAIFTPDYSILLLANKESTAQEIFSRIRMAYEMLPPWLKSAAPEYAKTSMRLENGSRIMISTTTSDSARGLAINMLLLDEFAFVENDDEFYNSVFPVLSASSKSKIFISSTPNGTENKYYKLVQDAEEKKGGYELVKIHWSDIPGRGKKWADEMKAGMASEEAWLQEFELVFLNTGDAALSDEHFKKLEASCRNPIQVMDGGAYRIWEKPDNEKIYVAGVDVGEGVGANASVINILDITDPGSIKMVAQYWTNTLSPTMFVQPLNMVLEQWGKPLVLIERNNCGAQVIDGLYAQYEYPYIVDWGIEKFGNIRSKKYTRQGVVSHTNVKFAAVSNMRYWLNDIKVLDIPCRETVFELKNFVRQPNGTWAAKPGKNDDRVMSLVWAINMLDPLCCQGFFTISEYDSYGKPKIITPAYHAFGVKYNVKDLDGTEESAEQGSFPTPMFSGTGTTQQQSEMRRYSMLGYQPVENNKFGIPEQKPEQRQQGRPPIRPSFGTGSGVLFGMAQDVSNRLK